MMELTLNHSVYRAPRICNAIFLPTIQRKDEEGTTKLEFGAPPHSATGQCSIPLILPWTFLRSRGFWRLIVASFTQEGVIRTARCLVPYAVSQFNDAESDQEVTMVGQHPEFALSAGRDDSYQPICMMDRVDNWVNLSIMRSGLSIDLLSYRCVLTRKGKAKVPVVFYCETFLFCIKRC